MSYTPTRRGHPCVHCSDELGKCRTHKTGQMHLCVSLADCKKGEKSQGYIVIGSTADGRWAQLLPNNGKDCSSRIEDLRRQSERQQERAKLERLAGEMPASERHKHYGDILSQLTLNPEDKADLLRRGFNDDQILRCKFKSIDQWQKLNKTYPANLPGINKYGNGLLSHSAGYVCPIKDENGLIVGLQIRKQQLADGDDQRYYFLSKDGSIRLNDQIPLTLLVPTERKSQRVGLTEGLGTKPFLTCERLGIPVIGASGGMWAASPNHLERYLAKLEVKPGDEIILFPDAGAVQNPSVINQYKRTTNLLTSWGYVVRFAWWAQVDRTFLDIDELEPEQFDNIRYLSVSEFKALCIKWKGLQPEKTSEVLPIDYESRVAVAQKKLHSLSYPADLVCDSTKRYLPDLLGRIPTKGIVALKAQKGSGKSHQIKLIKDHCCGYWEDKVIHPVAPELPPEQLELFGKTKAKQPEEKTLEPQVERIFHKGLGMKFLSINARISLGRAQAVQWSFTWVEDADGAEEFGTNKLKTTTILEEIGEIGLCWDSLGKIFGRDWSNTLVILDETELGLNHVATSSTCRERRSFILHTLEHKLRECLDNGGLVIAADADLTDSSLDYLTGIAPGHPPFIVSHDFKGNPWKIDFFTGKRDIVLSEIEEWLSDPNCEPIAITVDNQKECESLAAHLIKKYPRLANQERNGVIRVDSRTTQTDFGQNFVKRTNESIEKYQPKVLLYTPSLGVGVSIDVKYFARVFGLFFGNIEPSQARQCLGRVRQAVPRVVWAKTRAGSVESEEPTSFLPEEIKRRMFDYHNGGMVLLQAALAKAKQMAEDSGIVNAEDKDILPFLLETLQAMMGPDGTWNNPHLDLYCNQTARRNFALNQYAVQLREELLEEGHHLTDQVEDSTTNAGEAVRQGKDEIRRNDAALTANAKDITPDQAKEILRKPSKTDEESYQASKSLLREELPGLELTPDFLYKAVHKDNRRWLNQAKLYWHVFNLDALKDKDEREWRRKLKQFSEGVVFLPDVRTDTPKVEAILKSGILDWIKLNDLQTEYSNESEGGKEFVKTCYKNRKLIKTGLGISVKYDAEPIKLANRILDRIGLALTYSSSKGAKESRVRYYKLNQELATDSDREAVWNALNQRWQERQLKMAETTAQQGKIGVQIENNLLDKNSPSAHQNKPDESTQNDVVDYTTNASTVEAHEVDQELLLGVTEMLQDVENEEMLNDLRAIYPSGLLRLAARGLCSEQKHRLRQLLTAP